jgi:hypothetical protein
MSASSGLQLPAASFVYSAGALERNLAPLVASDIAPVPQPRPVAVTVSGVAFPHPEKVSRQRLDQEPAQQLLQHSLARAWC